MNYKNIFGKEILKPKEIEHLKKYETEGMTLLTREQLAMFGKDKVFYQEYALEDCKRLALLTDFALILGAYTRDKKPPYFGEFWAHDIYFGRYIEFRNIGCRPVIPYSSISKICSNNTVKSDYIEVEYGEYPQWVCSKDLSEELEKLYTNDKLNRTEKVYTTSSGHWNNVNKEYDLQQHIEYIYNDKKYVRVKAISKFNNRDFFTLSNGRNYKNGDFIWIEVSSIIWLVDKKSDIAVSKNIILTGIQFNKVDNYNGYNFNEMNIKIFMDKYLSKEIIPDNISYETNTQDKEETLEEVIVNMQREMKEILGEEYSYLLSDNKEENGYQKQLKK